MTYMFKVLCRLFTTQVLFSSVRPRVNYLGHGREELARETSAPQTAAEGPVFPAETPAPQETREGMLTPKSFSV